MSAEFWRSEVVIYGFMFLNMAAVASGALWAWRRGYLSNLNDETTGLRGGSGPLEMEEERRHV